MSGSTSPRAIAERLIRGSTDGQWAQLPDLYAENAVLEHPFAAGPTVLRGREQIRQHIARLAGLPAEFHLANLVVHETVDPEVIITEFRYDIRVTATGKSHSVDNIRVLRVRAGQIVSSRDYHNHAALAAAFNPAPTTSQ